MFALTSHRIGWSWPCWRPQAEMHCSHFKVILYFILEVSVQAVLSHVKQPAPATIYCGKPWSNILWEHLPSYCIITWNNLELAIVLTRVAMSHHYWKLVKLKRSNIQPTLFPSAHKEIGRGSLFLPLCVLLWSSSCPLTGSHTTIYTFAHIHFSWTGYHFLHGQN